MRKRFVKLLLFKVDTQYRLLYGFSSETEESSYPWKAFPADRKGQKLIAKAILSPSEADNFLISLTGTEPIMLCERVTLKSPQLYKREQLLYSDDEEQQAVPISEFCYLFEFWNREKLSLLSEIQNEFSADGRTRYEQTLELLEWAKCNCGIDFCIDGRRFGNYEVYYRTPENSSFEIDIHKDQGLRVTTIRKRKDFAEDIIVNCIGKYKDYVICNQTQVWPANKKEIYFEAIKTVVDDPIPVTPVEADKELVAQIMEELQPYFENYYTDIADRRNHADNYLVKCQELLATLDRDIVASEASPLAIDGLNPDVVFDKTAPLETQHWLTGLHEHTLDGYGIPVGSAEGESALVLSAYVPQHKGEVDGGAEVPLLYFFTYSVDDIQSLEDYAFIHGQIITFEQLEQYKVYEDDQYVCYEVTDLFYTNLRQHVESIISQRSDIYFDEQVWERVENIYTYYKDRDVLASRFYYNVPVE